MEKRLIKAPRRSSAPTPEHPVCPGGSWDVLALGGQEWRKHRLTPTPNARATNKTLL